MPGWQIAAVRNRARLVFLLARHAAAADDQPFSQFIIGSAVDFVEHRGPLLRIRLEHRQFRFAGRVSRRRDRRARRLSLDPDHFGREASRWGTKPVPACQGAGRRLDVAAASQTAAAESHSRREHKYQSSAHGQDLLFWTCYFGLAISDLPFRTCRFDLAVSICDLDLLSRSSRGLIGS
jgi:hypothetical protein